MLFEARPLVFEVKIKVLTALDGGTLPVSNLIAISLTLGQKIVQTSIDSNLRVVHSIY